MKFCSWAWISYLLELKYRWIHVSPKPFQLLIPFVHKSTHKQCVTFPVAIFWLNSYYLQSSLDANTHGAFVNYSFMIQILCLTRARKGKLERKKFSISQDYEKDYNIPLVCLATAKSTSDIRFERCFSGRHLSGVATIALYAKFVFCVSGNIVQDVRTVMWVIVCNWIWNLSIVQQLFTQRTASDRTKKMKAKQRNKHESHMLLITCRTSTKWHLT